MPQLTNQGCVIWLTGLSGSGKTTIALLLEQHLQQLGKRVAILDGDEIRRGLSPELGFSNEDRERHNRRVIFLAEMLVGQGSAVIIPLISPFRAVRDEARERLTPFVEVFVDASIDVCIQRDPKGLYKKALAGQINDMTGLGSPYEPPLNPELVIKTETQTPPESARVILDYVTQQGWIPAVPTAQPRVAVIGLDSITPVMVEPFLEQGRMPNLKRLREKGWWSEVTPTMPATTPAGWTTVATGAWPSTHGIEGFAIHQEGDPLDKKTHSLSTVRVKAESIWQVAEQAGKRTILLKYPMSWPPTGGDKVLQVDGAGGWGGLKCVWDLAHSGCWDTAEGKPAAAPEAGEAVGPQDWLTRDSDNLDEECVKQLRIGPPGEWVNLPAGAEALWETQVELGRPGAGAPIYILAVQQWGGTSLLVALARDGATACTVANREWTDWLTVSLPKEGQPHTGHVRFKVMEFDAQAPRLRLYQTQVHQADGFTQPAALAGDLLQAAGPFVEWTESYDLLQGWIDDETQLEIYEQHVDWMCRAARHLLQHNPWDLFMTQVHFLDMAYHMYWGAVDPGHPEYDEARAPYYWDLLGRVHELADRFLGAVLEAAGPDTLVIVTGDHGHDLYHTSFAANHVLLREGLLTVSRDPRTGAPRIDWSRTYAYASSYRVYLNVAGREPQGIIAPEQYRQVQERVIQALYRSRDPRTGESAVRLAVRREDAEALGLYGGTMGDVVFAMAPGFQTRSSIHLPPGAWTGRRLLLDEVPVFRPTQLFREFTGEHDTAFPMTRAIRTLCYMAGPGVNAGKRRVPIRLVDLAPTICQYLGLEFPAQCEGSPLWEVLGTGKA